MQVTLIHLQNWWKNVKDWYVRLRKRASGQAAKQLTDRDKWVLRNLAFYSGEYIYLYFHFHLNLFSNLPSMFIILNYLLLLIQL